MANICILGLWHQGVVLSGCFAALGHQVSGIGENEGIVAALSASEAPVYEPKLKTILRRSMRAGRLTFSTDPREALRGADFAYISVDTPVGANDESDVSSVLAAAREIGRNMSGKLTVVVTAQVPIGTCEQVLAILREENPAANFDIAYVPEFLRLGAAVESFRRADRFVVGADQPEVAERVAQLYRPLGRPIIETNLRTAEMAKHASNAYLATSVSFINQIADLCDKENADALQVAEIMKLDRRIGRNAFLTPGLGFAGGTLGRDLRVLQSLGREHQCPTVLIDAVVAVNENRARLVCRRLEESFGAVDGLQIGVLGLTYKPGTSTLRRSVALDIIRHLNAKGASVKAFDPLARLDEVADLPAFDFLSSPYDVADGSDALVLMTEWKGIRDLRLADLRAAMRRPVFIDTRNVLDPARMLDAGFVYWGIGRGQQWKGGLGHGS